MALPNELPNPIQAYLVPVREDDLIKPDGAEGDFETISGALSTDDSPIESLISIAVAAPGTIVYYDHWEDGYELDVTNPGATTLIWGDGDDTNGVAPGTGGTDVFSGGESFVLGSTVPVNRSTDDFYFDGSDQISATFPIAVTRAAFPSDTGSVIAGATEALDTDRFGDTFEMPVGVDMTGDVTDAFEVTSAHVMASVANTPIYVNGDFVTTIDAGETFVLENVEQGDVLRTFDAATESGGDGVQVTLVTGGEDSGFETRWYSLQPREDWSNDYYTPVFTGENAGPFDDSSGFGPTQVWLYNPNDGELTVTMETADGGSTTVDVPAGGSALSPLIPDDSGARFFSDDGRDFFAVTQTDSTGFGQVNDWGHPLVPADQLTSQAIIGLGFGNTDQIFGGNSGDDRSPVWVAATADETTVNVDYDGDGDVDDTFELDRLESRKVADESDNDMSGAIIFANDEDGEPVDIAVAYGQDSETPAFESNSLDFGTVVPPLPELEASKSVSLVDDADGDGQFSPGDTVSYEINILNFGRVDLAAGGYVVDDEGVPVFDRLVEGDGEGPLAYVPNSTAIDVDPADPGGESAIVDGGAGTPFPLDGLGYTSGAVLEACKSHVVSFRAVIKDFAELPAGTDDFTNEGALLNNAGGEIDTFDVTRPLAFDSGIDIEKATNGVDADTAADGPEIAEGDAVTWTYTVENTGETHLADVDVVDDRGVDVSFVSGDADGDDVLDPGETWLFEGKGAAEIGDYANVGEVDATAVFADGTTPVPGSAGGGEVADSDPSHYTGVPNNPSLAFDKKVTDVAGQGASGTLTAAGQVVTYELVVTNDGDVPLTGVSVVDPLLGVDETIGDLPVGESATVTASYTVTQDDLDGNGIDATGATDGDGDVDNRALATSDQTDEVADAAAVPLALDPAIAIDKTADVDTITGPGEDVVYSYTVTNEGNVALTDVVVTDDDFTPDDPSDDFNPTFLDGDADGDGALDVGETWLYEETRTIDAADISAAAGTADSLAFVIDGPVQTQITVSEIPGGDLEVAIEVLSDTGSIGDLRGLFFDVSDEGKLAGLSVSGADVTGDEIAADSVSNLGGGVNVNGDVLNDFGAFDGGVAFGTQGIGTDDVRSTTFVLSHGSEPLGIDLLAGQDFAVRLTSVGPEGGDRGGSLKLAATAPEAAPADGTPCLVNVATVDSAETDPVTDDAEVCVAPDPALAFDKVVTDVDGRGPDAAITAAGQVIAYELVARNEGNVALTNVTIEDPLTNVTETVDTLAPGETAKVSSSYTVGQADLDGNGIDADGAIDGDGDIDNVATADSDQTAPETDAEAVLLARSPAIAIVKTATPDSASADGEAVTFAYTVTNEGNVALTDVSVVDDAWTPGDASDDFAPSFTGGDDDGDGELDVDETWTYEATGTVTQAQVDAGEDLVNVVTVDSAETDPATDEATVTIAGAPALAFDKVVTDVDGRGPDAAITAAGQVIAYELVARNEGNVTLTNVTIEDPLTNVTETVDTLAPGESAKVSASYTVGQADLDGNGIDADGAIDGDGDIDNEATADSDQTGPESDAEAVLLERSPAVAIVKTADRAVVERAGDTVTYTYVVSNEGNVALSNVRVTDDDYTAGDPSDDYVLDLDDLASGDADGDGKLDLDETWTFEATVEITDDQIAAEAPLTNVAVVTTDEGATASDEETVTVDPPVTFCTDIEEHFERPEGNAGATYVYGPDVPHRNGTNGDDFIVGDDRGQAISTNGGENRVVANGGNDIVNGGNDGDALYGDAGDDILNGNGGDDALSGGEGDDKLYGAHGDDKILAGDGDDLVEAGEGDDRVHLGAGNDTAQGEGGDDCIAGGADFGRITGDATRGFRVELGDELFGNGGNDVFEYTAGDGVDLVFDFSDTSGDGVRIRGYEADEAQFVTARTPYGEFGGIVFENAEGELEGMFFQQARSAETVESWVEDGSIQLLS